MDKAHITLRTQWGISQLAKGEWNLMNTAERIQFEKEVGLDAGQDYDLLSQTDVNWRDMVFNDNAMLQKLRPFYQPRHRTLELFRFRKFLRSGWYCSKALRFAVTPCVPTQR